MPVSNLDRRGSGFAIARQWLVRGGSTIARAIGTAERAVELMCRRG